VVPLNGQRQYKRRSVHPVSHNPHRVLRGSAGAPNHVLIIGGRPVSKFSNTRHRIEGLQRPRMEQNAVSPTTQGFAWTRTRSRSS
jgi:hypothetical protein